MKKWRCDQKNKKNDEQMKFHEFWDSMKARKLAPQLAENSWSTASVRFSLVRFTSVQYPWLILYDAIRSVSSSFLFMAHVYLQIPNTLHKNLISSGRSAILPAFSITMATNHQLLCLKYPETMVFHRGCTHLRPSSAEWAWSHMGLSQWSSISILFNPMNNHKTGS
jgi:hypothetical protein